MERGESLQAMAFVGTFAEFKVVPIPINTTGDAAKDRAAQAIRRVAEVTAADFVLTITEAWALPTAQAPNHAALLRKYGSVANCPGRLDVVSFMLETVRGGWAGQAEIKPMGISKKKRTFGAVDFEPIDSINGRFGGLLPRQPAHTLH
jgi:hypothetical protein